MSNVHKDRFLSDLTQRFGPVKKLEGSLSLFSLGTSDVRLYVRYSKIHNGDRSFFGLREVDLRKLEGHDSYICFILSNSSPPVFVPFADFEEVFRNSQPAADGQHKVQLLRGKHDLELYIARQGRFNVEAYLGFGVIEDAIKGATLRMPELGHSDIQSLLGGIGIMKGYDVWIPTSDCARLQWTLTPRFQPVSRVPAGYGEVVTVLSEIDVVWVGKGGNSIEGLFEVEHSTSIYSGLLRFNDLLLTNPKLKQFSIVSDDSRRSLFARQLRRPTFVRSGLSELTSFLDYTNVYQWHLRLSKVRTDASERKLS
ncbi:MAG TPA: hypothetical protein VF011_16810 [Terriglobales bacterium]